MALVKCSECAKVVSDKAAACPGCGAPIAMTMRVVRAGWRWEAIGSIACILGLTIAMTAGGAFGVFMLFVGFIIFMVGRFID